MNFTMKGKGNHILILLFEFLWILFKKRKPIQDILNSICDSVKPKNKQPKLLLINDFIPDVEMPRLYKSVDCLVVPSKGEGWGRPHCEAMSTGYIKLKNVYMHVHIIFF